MTGDPGEKIVIRHDDLTDGGSRATRPDVIRIPAEPVAAPTHRPDPVLTPLAALPLASSTKFLIGTVGLLALLVIVVVSAWFWGTGQEQRRRLAEQQAIRTVFDQDRALLQEIEQQVGPSERYWDGSALVDQLAQRMDGIDLSACPQEFQAAYKRHVAAWEELARVKASNEGWSGMFKAFFSGGLSVYPGMSELERAAKHVQATKAELAQVAIRYGVAP